MTRLVPLYGHMHIHTFIIIWLLKNLVTIIATCTIKVHLSVFPHCQNTIYIFLKMWNLENLEYFENLKNLEHFGGNLKIKIKHFDIFETLKISKFFEKHLRTKISTFFKTKHQKNLIFVFYFEKSQTFWKSDNIICGIYKNKFCITHTLLTTDNTYIKKYSFPKTNILK